ncbi:MAG: hypothetical protein HXS54_01185 [Theionarchaea archaeon]|nr:hypothetical protein [Theionarchaea archaeon]
MKCIICGRKNCSTIIMNAYVKSIPLCCFCSKAEHLCDICSQKFELIFNLINGKSIIFMKDRSDYTKEEGWPGILSNPLKRRNNVISTYEGVNK